jgi:hypothetical protein
MLCDKVYSRRAGSGGQNISIWQASCFSSAALGRLANFLILFLNRIVEEVVEEAAD